MNKSLLEMSDKEFNDHLKSIKPYLPPWKQEGCSIVSKENKVFTDRNNNQALIGYANWKDKKGKQFNSIAWVRWE